MGLLQNYLGLEPAYKDGYDLPLLDMMKQHYIKIGRALARERRLRDQAVAMLLPSFRCMSGPLPVGCGMT